MLRRPGLPPTGRTDDGIPVSTSTAGGVDCCTGPEERVDLLTFEDLDPPNHSPLAADCGASEAGAPSGTISVQQHLRVLHEQAAPPPLDTTLDPTPLF